MSALDPRCYWDGDLERWSNCDGHWFCRCAIPRDAALAVRVLAWSRNKLLAHRYRLPSKQLVSSVLWIERAIRGRS